MNLFERNKFDRNAQTSIYFEFLFKGTLFIDEIKLSNYELFLAFRSARIVSPRDYFFMDFRCMEGNKNEVELQPWKLNVNYLKATSHYAINFLDTLEGRCQFLLYRTIRYSEREL